MAKRFDTFSNSFGFGCSRILVLAHPKCLADPIFYQDSLVTTLDQKITNLEQVLLLGLPEITIHKTLFRCNRLLQLIYLQSVH